MDLESLLENYQPAYGGSWKEAFKLIAQSPAELDRVQILQGILQRDQAFKAPVCLDVEEGRILNGMHRLYAHHLSGVSEVNVAEGLVGHPDLPEIHVVFTYQAKTDDAFMDDLLAEAVKSFPVGEDWAETDFFSGTQDDGVGSLEGYWYWPADRIPELTYTLGARAARWGYTIEIVSAKVADPWL